MKIKPFKILGKLLLSGAPIIAGAVGGPGAAAVVVAGMGAAGLTKKGGQIIEERTGVRPHKVASPAVAVGVPVALAQYLPPETLESLCEWATRICDNPGAILGLLGLLWHVMVSNVTKTVGQSDE